MTNTTPPDTDSLPPVEWLDARREQLGVAKRNLACVIGYGHTGSMPNAIRNGSMPAEKRRRMLIALDHVEKMGYLPLPEEVADD